MSKATILGAALRNMISIGFVRYPDKSSNRPWMCYEASAFMHSGELLGVVFGVLLSLLLTRKAQGDNLVVRSMR